MDPTLALDQYAFDQWWMEDGLPSNSVLDMAQTRDGYLWITTPHGLARFDGADFTSFDLGNTPQLQSSRVEPLCESRDGGLWLGTKRGVVRYKTGRPPTFAPIDGTGDFYVIGLFEDRSGTLWIGTASKGAWILRDGMLSRVASKATNFRDFCQDEQGTIWSGSAFGLFKFDGEKLERVGPRRGAPTIALDREGSLWVGTFEHGLFRYRDGAFEDMGERCGLDLKKDRISEILIDRSGTLWIATNRRGALRIKGGVIERLDATESRAGSVSVLLEDREGSLWIGGGVKGLRRLKTPEAVRFDESHGLASSNVSSVIRDGEGGVWIGNAGGVSRFSEGEFTNYSTVDGLPDNRVMNLARGLDGTLWVLTMDGMARFDGNSFGVVNGLKSSDMHGAYIDRSGALWVSYFRSRGMSRIVDGEVTNYDTELKAVHWFHESSSGAFLCGVQDGLYHWDGEALVKIEDPVLPRADYITHYVDPDGVIWIGTVGFGLYRLAAGKFTAYDTGDGLLDDTIGMVHGDRRGNLWLGSEHGVCWIARSAFNELDIGKRAWLSPQLVGNSRQNERFRSRAHHANACLAADGSLWIASPNGVGVVPPEGPYMNPVSPQVWIEQVRVDGTPIPSDVAFDLEWGVRRYAFKFTATSLFQSDRVRFKYRLTGHDDDWIDVGAERIAHYTDLPPGNYRFEVAAQNGHGIWNEEAESLGFEITPRWWQLRWLQLFAGLGFAVVLVGGTVTFYRKRTRLLKNHNAELQRKIAERDRAEGEARKHLEELVHVSRLSVLGELSSSLAHELNQPLTAILSNVETAIVLLDSGSPNSGDLRELLDDILADDERAAGIVENLREMVRKRPPKREPTDLNELIRQVDRLVHSDAIMHNISVTLQLDPTLPEVMIDPVQVQQVIVNLLLNAFAAAGEAERGEGSVVLRSSVEDESHAKVSVSDSGPGVSLEQRERIFEPFFTTRPKGIGMGLSICRHIIVSGGGRLWVGDQHENGGAVFHFSVPLENTKV